MEKTEETDTTETQRDESRPPEAGEGTLTPEKTLFSWRAPVRPFKERSRQFFSSVVAVAILLSIIGYVLEGIMAVLLIWAVVFLVFVLFRVRPEEAEFKLTNKNLFIADKKYPLEEMSRFWIIKRLEHTLLVFETPLRFPGRIELVLSGIEPEQLRRELEKHIPYEEELPGFVEKSSSWLSKKLSLDK